MLACELMATTLFQMRRKCWYKTYEDSVVASVILLLFTDFEFFAAQVASKVAVVRNIDNSTVVGL